MSDQPSNPPGGQIIVYQTEDGRSALRVRLENETVWLTQGHLAELYQTTKQNISLHIRNILEEGELRADSVVKEYLTTASDGKTYRVHHDAFAERRRLEAEAAAEARYLDDLRSTAKTLGDQRQPPPAPKPKAAKRAARPRKAKPGDTDKGATP